MPCLASTRHEMFATALAAGNTALTAYVAAGYRADLIAAHSLSQSPIIQRRVAELAPHYGALARGGDDP